MVFDVEEDVALPLEDHGLTDDLRKDVGAVVLGAYLGREYFTFRLRLLDELGLVQRVKVALDTGGGEGHLDTGVVVAAENGCASHWYSQLGREATHGYKRGSELA